MSILKIDELRKQRKAKVEGLKHKYDQIKNAPEYAPEYKQDKQQEIEKQLENVRQEYDQQINELLTTKKNELQKAMYEAEFDDMKDGTKALLMEMRLQEQGNFLSEQYKDKKDTLQAEAEQLVTNNQPEAQAHIKAMKNLKMAEAELLEKRYKEQNLTPTQRKIKGELDMLAEQEKGFKSDQVKDVDPFTSTLLGKRI